MRLSKITTRTGDTGITGLADGTRLGKDHARFAKTFDVTWGVWLPPDSGPIRVNVSQ